MLSRARTLIAPAYLFACLLLGGSAQGVWFNMVLQLAGLVLIAWAAGHRSDEPLSPEVRQLLILAGLGVAFVAVQLIPLPPSIWTHLPGRAHVVQGFVTLGVPLPWQPLSLTPAATLDSLLGIIPPLAIFCTLVRLKAYRPVFMSLALLAGTIAGIGLSAIQVASSRADVSRFYLYGQSNFGKGVGFFANADHMATLLVISIPFLAAIAAAARGRSKQRYVAAVTVAAGTAVVVLAGIALNGSLAGYGLAGPVAVASLLILIPLANRLRPLILGASAILIVVAVLVVQNAAIGSQAVNIHADKAIDSRAAIFRTTAQAAADMMPLGSGLGSFRSVYPLYEKPQDVDPTYVVHAHDDYAELVLELGLPGALLLIAFAAWWVLVVWRLWRSAEPKVFNRAAAIASAAIMLHSIVDFPLRTAAIAACFAMCLALLADGRAAAPEQKKALRRNRHVEFR